MHSPIQSVLCSSALHERRTWWCTKRMKNDIELRCTSCNGIAASDVVKLRKRGFLPNFAQVCNTLSRNLYRANRLALWDNEERIREGEDLNIEAHLTRSWPGVPISQWTAQVSMFGFSPFSKLCLNVASILYRQNYELDIAISRAKACRACPYQKEVGLKYWHNPNFQND